jgi:hypothetical protein
MNGSLEPVRKIARDLVEKKLWPVAALLVVALVAVPIMIGTSARDAPAVDTAAAPAPISAGAAKQSLVTVVDQPVTGGDDRSGEVSDPFYDPPDANDNAPTQAPAAADAAASGAKPAGDAASAGAPPVTVPSEPTGPVEPVAAPVYYSTVVRWWENEPGRPEPIRRLTPFGGLVDTAVLYLGVTKSDGNYAVFLLGPNATSDGEAKCEDAECRVFGLKSGQTQIVTVTPADGGEVRQYNLDVVSVKAHEADGDTLSRMRARVHIDGRDVMRELWSDARTAEALRPIQYDKTIGLLVKSATAATAAAADTSE